MRLCSEDRNYHKCKRSEASDPHKCYFRCFCVLLQQFACVYCGFKQSAYLLLHHKSLYLACSSLVCWWVFLPAGHRR